MPTLPGQAASAAPGLQGFDAASPVSAAEATAILAGWLALMAVQNSASSTCRKPQNAAIQISVRRYGMPAAYTGQ